MPIGVYRHKPLSRETKRKISEIKKGNKFGCGNKGNIRPMDVRKKISESHKGLRPTDRTRNKMSDSQKGKKRSNEVRMNMSKAMKGKNTCKFKNNNVLENNKIRISIEFRLWREAVFARDNYTCQKCEERGGNLHPHHIQNFAQYPELRFAIDNGITFCKDCHYNFHKKYGFKNNTLEQLIEFLNK